MLPWLVMVTACMFSRVVFLHAEDGIRDRNVTGVQTCALPISSKDGEELTFSLIFNHYVGGSVTAIEDVIATVLAEHELSEEGHCVSKLAMNGSLSCSARITLSCASSIGQFNVLAVFP